MCLATLQKNRRKEGKKGDKKKKNEKEEKKKNRRKKVFIKRLLKFKGMSWRLVEKQFVN